MQLLPWQHRAHLGDFRAREGAWVARPRQVGPVAGVALVVLVARCVWALLVEVAGPGVPGSFVYVPV